MKEANMIRRILIGSISVLSLALISCGEEGPPKPPPPAPPEYADKHMPAGYWSDPEVIEAGRQIYIGAHNIDVNCASCHGKDGKPKKAGARDFRRTEQMKLYSDSQWFWRVSEGVKGTKMKPWKTKLSEDERWKVIAYERTFGLKDMEYDSVKGAWVTLGTAGTAPAEGGAMDQAPADGSGAEAGSTEQAPE